MRLPSRRYDGADDPELTTALTTYKSQRSGEMSTYLQPLEDKLTRVNELLGPNQMFPITLNSKHFHTSEPHVLEPHKLYHGGHPIKGATRVSRETDLGGVPSKMLMNGLGSTPFLK